MQNSKEDRKPELTTPALRPVPSATWRELIKLVWEVDPLLCPRCDAEMVEINDWVVTTNILRRQECRRSQLEA
jgi:hypothetical protein